ncbi:MAG TPA: cytochrome c biogenesis protein CcdA [Lacipirellulaceae bacterium]|nr:cytochrome c biogenesis protein CcdA [Lacipirellulaceae bacterium]
MRQFFSLLFVIASLVAAIPAGAQAPGNSFDSGIVGRFDRSAGSFSAPATISTRFTRPTADQPAILFITAKIARGRHAYSLTQPPGGPEPTKINLQRSSDYRLLAPFRPSPEPKSHVETGAEWNGLTIEEHEGEVTWYAPIEITAGINPETLEIHGDIHLLVCKTGGDCVPVTEQFIAGEGPSPNPAIRIADWPPKSAIGHPNSTVTSFQIKGSAAKFSGRLVPATVRPGESADLHITAMLPESSHIFTVADRDPSEGPKPTLIAEQVSSGLRLKRPTTNATAIVDNSSPVMGPVHYHQGEVTWTQLIEVPKNAPPGDYPIAGLIGYQVCDGPGDRAQCELPHAVQFATSLKVGSERSQTDAPLTFAPGESYKAVAQAADALAKSYDEPPPTSLAEVPAARPDQGVAAASAATSTGPAYDLNRVTLQSAETGTLSYYIALAFVGGLILNLMPCVLPVIGLKVMSFVEQSGKSRSHALMLNVWFSIGIISVFLLLGLLAATIGLSWGGQFGKTSFNVTIAAVVFAMALSLLGVWEIPIPGFFGSGSVQSAAAKEGPLGAFLKGVVTTVLATPCTAPLMAAAIAWAVTQPIVTNLIVFATVGLGMASPYLLVGVYPELLRFLPKPGHWMETFKQISGFVLLGTVVFILSFIEPAAVVPTIMLLLGVAVACWVVARTPLTAEIGERLRSWATASVVLLLFIGLSFGVMYRLATAPMDQAWQPFSLERLQQVAVQEGKTVLVDFSAEWCFNCKVFEKSVLHTTAVEQAIAKSGATTMYADFTKYPPEIAETIKRLGANGVPVIAIFPGNTPYQPIVFRGGYRQQDIIDGLAEANSRRAAPAVSRETGPPIFTPAVVR